MSIFFTADTHFNHSNIILLCNRQYFKPEDVVETNGVLDFKSIEAKHLCTHLMNEDLIFKWNSTVTSDDTIYHLGDFGFGNKASVEAILSRLRGHIILVRGNHDYDAVVKAKGFQHVTHKYQGYVLRLKEMEQTIFLSHYQMSAWPEQREGAWHLHGHTHGKGHHGLHELSKGVGVDCNDFRPVSLDTVCTRMRRRLEIKKMFDATPGHDVEVWTG